MEATILDAQISYAGFHDAAHEGEDIRPVKLDVAQRCAWCKRARSLRAGLVLGWLRYASSRS